MGILAILGVEAALRLQASATGRQRALDYHAVYGWRMLPQVQRQGGGWGRTGPCGTNRHGWRDDERELARTPGRRRILALGDSFTFGQGVDRRERFTERLAAALPATEVVNLGMCATGPDQHLLIHEHEGRNYAPDLVLLTLFLGNDLDDLRNRQQAGWAKPWFRLGDGQELELVPPEQGLLTWLRTRSYLLEVLGQALGRGGAGSRRAEAWQDDAADTVPLLVALLRRLAARVEADGQRLLVVAVPPPDRSMGEGPDPLQARVLAALAAAGIDAVDAWPWFRSSGGAFDELFLPDLHWSPQGHQVAADGITAALRARGW